VTLVRAPAVAGRFYPADPDELAAMVDALLDAARPASVDGDLVGLVVPHAGYAYSGPVAATAYALARDSPRRSVAILGPSHFVPLRSAAVPAHAGWATPLGEVTVDPGLRLAAAGAGAVIADAPHEVEHALEVQLPFLQRVLGPGVAVLPVAVGDVEAGRVAEVIEALRAAGAFVVTSTDLSHYEDDATANALDERTAEAVCARDAGAIGREAACGVFALRGTAEHARRAGLSVRLLDRRTSAEATGDPSSVVGYASFALVAP
jgi:hypothetical protein